jgi:hypothetical protein
VKSFKLTKKSINTTLWCPVVSKKFQKIDGHPLQDVVFLDPPGAALQLPSRTMTVFDETMMEADTGYSVKALNDIATAVFKQVSRYIKS